MSVFDEMGKYWAEIADQNQTGRQIQFLQEMLKKNGWVLDLACGTGRHLIPLSNEGYVVVGLDISPNLLRIAKTRWREAQLVRADLRFLPFQPDAFSAAVSMDTSLGYLPSEQEDRQSLRELRVVVHRDGVLIVDVFNCKRLMKRYQANGEPKRREYASFFLLQERMVTTDGSRLHDLWTVRDKADGQVRVFEHVARLYTLGSLQGIVEKAGFSVKAVYGDYEGQTFSSESSRLIFIAKAS
jgi:ubiquinone/menaquinone biosynthesis C-methylase UbiE